MLTSLHKSREQRSEMRALKRHLKSRQRSLKGSWMPVCSSFQRLTLCELSVKTHKWIGDCFIYTNTANRLNYLVGTETQTVTHFDKYVLLR